MPTDDNPPSSPPSSNIVPLNGSHSQIYNHGEPNEELVNKLNEMLEEANSGYLRAIAFVRVTSDRSIVHGWAGSCDHHDMTAGVAKLNFRFMYDGYLGEEREMTPVQQVVYDFYMANTKEGDPKRHVANNIKDGYVDDLFFMKMAKYVWEEAFNEGYGCGSNNMIGQG